MTHQSAVTVIAARFEGPLSKGADTSAAPKGATLSAAGTETDWTAQDGFPRRERTVRIWMAIWQDLDAAVSFVEARADHVPLLAQAAETTALLGVPFACHGDLNWSPDGNVSTLYPYLSTRPADLQPVLVMTSLGIGDPENGLVEFGQGVKAVREGFARNPAVLLDLPTLTTPTGDAVLGGGDGLLSAAVGFDA